MDPITMTRETSLEGRWKMRRGTENDYVQWCTAGVGIRLSHLRSEGGMSLRLRGESKVQATTP